jgi:trk system potassium uptake protein
MPEGNPHVQCGRGLPRSPGGEPPYCCPAGSAIHLRPSVSERPSIIFSKWDLPEQRWWVAPWRALTPPQLLVGSFAILILLGTLGFKTLPGLYAGPELSWLDALFTATSAVCVTGLIVVDTATFFTLAGQAYILLLIQLGGLGIITFTSLIIVALGRRLSLRAEALSLEREIAPHISRKHLVRDVVLFTFIIEAIGALLLYIIWLPHYDWNFRAAAWPALFHAISAFCNAGFSTYTDSMMPFQQSPVTLMVVMMLFIIGGLGFLTLEELYLRRKGGQRERVFRVSLHSRIVLGTTALLLVLGWALFAMFEWNVTLGHLGPVDKLSNALFMSATPRTAGFNCIDYSEATAATSFLTVLLMAIGGSPGSTAGGLKTTTAALIALLAWSRFRRHEVTSLAGRSVPEETIQRAVGIFAVATALLCTAVLVLTATEAGGAAPGRFLEYLFEVTSAFNTVGLSMGATPELSAAGRWMTVLLMFLGRVGPLTLAAALALRAATPAGEFRYAYEDVVVG